MEQGILIINKPAGPTSHDIVDKIRNISGAKKVGHTGTLDPFAEGILILLVGQATKLQSKFMEMQKTYIATLKLGETTDTYDVTGVKFSTYIPTAIKAPASKQIQKILKQFIGKIKQIPPAFSAIKIKGKKAYELARKGINPNLKPRKIKIYEIQLRKFEWPWLEIKVRCGKGTYIRSLANDIGKKLGCGAYLEKLVRTKIGKFDIKDSLRLKDLTHKNWTKKIISVNM